MFHKYQHLERFGTTEVQMIELGEAYVFPKLDGTNASVWMENGELQAGSRNRQLSLDNDNAGFYAWVLKEGFNFRKFFAQYPDAILYGEWLVPHSLKTYHKEAWRNFYVFDVAVPKKPEEILHEGDDAIKYIPYQNYVSQLQACEIAYIHPIAIIRNGSYEQFIDQLAKNVFLIEDGKGAGEGIVIKNYEFKNKFNRQVWAKVVTNEFKEKHALTMGASEINGKKLVEEEIAQKFITESLVEKEHAKIVNEDGWSSKLIPKLLNVVYYSLVKEEAWEFVKEFKSPVIDFNRLKHFAFARTKALKPELF